MHPLEGRQIRIEDLCPCWSSVPARECVGVCARLCARMYTCVCVCVCMCVCACVCETQGHIIGQRCVHCYGFTGHRTWGCGTGH